MTVGDKGMPSLWPAVPLQGVPGLSVSPISAHNRAKKIRNKAVVNTSTLTKESNAENSKLLLGGGHSRTAGKLSQESTLSPSQRAESWRRDQHAAWGGHLASLSGARRKPGAPEGPCPGHLGPDLGRNPFEINVDNTCDCKKLCPCSF